MTRYYKLSGAGNDFLALVEPAADPPAERIRAWCRRGASLGADGLFVLRRTSRGARMDHFNADGKPAALCLNGTRCAARLAFELGWAADRLEVETGAGPLEARRVDDTRVAVRLQAPGRPRARRLEVGGEALAGWQLTVGVPHFVLSWPEPLEQAPVERLGPALRLHPDLGPAGANVDFVRFANRHDLEIRTWERGVEGETQACGTGVLAAAAVGLATGVSQLPVAALTRSGFLLEVAAASPGAWTLTGDARLLAEGELRPAAEALPPPPAAVAGSLG